MNGPAPRTGRRTSVCSLSSIDRLSIFQASTTCNSPRSALRLARSNILARRKIVLFVSCWTILACCSVITLGP